MNSENKSSHKARRLILLALLLAFSLSGCKTAESYMSMPEPELTPEQIEMARQERIGWFQEARYGLFIHWGLYASLPEHGRNMFGNVAIPSGSCSVGKSPVKNTRS